MERRDFVKGAFGLAIITAGAGIGFAGAGSASSGIDESSVVFETAGGSIPEDAVGPVMQAGIQLVERPGSTELLGCYEGRELFTVNPIGAALIGLADGSRTIDELTNQAEDLMGRVVNPADAASFFVTLGQAGYLQNTVLVNLYEIPE